MYTEKERMETGFRAEMNETNRGASDKWMRRDLLYTEQAEKLLY